MALDNIIKKQEAERLAISKKRAAQLRSKGFSESKIRTSLKKQGYDYKFIPEGEKKMAKKLTESQKKELARKRKLVKDSNNNKIAVAQLKRYMKKLGIEPKAVKKEVKPKEVKPKEEKISEVDMYPKEKKSVKKIISSATKKDKRFTKKIPVIGGPKATKRKPISEVDMYPKEKKSVKKIISSATKKDKRFKKRTGIVPKKVLKRIEPKIEPKIAPKPKRKPIDTTGVTLSPTGTGISRLKAKQRVRDVTLPRRKGPSQLQLRLQEERKIPEEDSPAAYHAAKAAKIKAEPKPKKVKPTLWGSEESGKSWFKKHFPGLEVEYTYPEEINDKKGGYLKKDLKKAKARRRAALRGHRKELRGG